MAFLLDSFEFGSTLIWHNNITTIYSILLVEWDLYVGSSSVVFLRRQHHTMLQMRAAISSRSRMTPRQMAAMAASFKYTSLTSMVRLL